jgi:hypothetical protein
MTATTKSTFYQGKLRQDDRLIRFLTMANALVAVSVLSAWTVVSIFLAEPVTWATHAPLSVGSRPDFTDYPFVLLWLGPVTGMAVSWLADKAGMRSITYAALWIPLCLLVIVLLWFNLAPMHLR